MKNKIYKIEEDAFRKIYERVENVTESLHVLKYFCDGHNYSEDIININPILKYIYDNAMDLYCYFINKSDANENEYIPFEN
ncbi:MAG: hypothetical protein NC200_03890 [Candidatus Gastranaerophilales bacterium]|nr:hypothetical protein [Candidatus Gastranaerophilales bacterium]